MATVLILEDDMLLLRAIEDKLTREGFRILTSRTFEQAFTQLALPDTVVDLVWLDHYLLGKETGLDFLAKLRSEPRWHETPVFIVSNSANPEMVRQYQALGISRYYTKSDFRLEQIADDIKKFLHA
ncbi:MAG: response regulator [Patescibacteria group bacterium]